ncbi:hypothetical protein OIU79_025782 [Salix purpurea]|uniref:Uncharacterized protein n=1 Tax=Salix purpurea TaxID=77065 RepID=A0A9Q1A7D5_SALPP|nr:hypothetical protein OIU79_025782 [Salix purpurea]
MINPVRPHLEWTQWAPPLPLLVSLSWTGGADEPLKFGLLPYNVWVKLERELGM